MASTYWKLTSGRGWNNQLTHTQFLGKWELFICRNKMPTRCNRGFYCRSYCLNNMFRASLCPSSGAQEYYIVVAACGISCCKSVKNHFVSFCGICVLSLKCRVLSRFVTRCVECRGGCVWVVLVGFFFENTNSTKTYKIIFYAFTARNTTGSNHCIILLSSWWWA